MYTKIRSENVFILMTYVLINRVAQWTETTPIKQFNFHYQISIRDSLIESKIRICDALVKRGFEKTQLMIQFVLLMV